MLLFSYRLKKYLMRHLNKMYFYFKGSSMANIHLLDSDLFKLNGKNLLEVAFEDDGDGFVFG